jgi:hypothetical protein
MYRFVVPMLAALVVSSPLMAQQPPAVRDTAKPAAQAKPGPKTDSAAGEVARPDSAKAKKDAILPTQPALTKAQPPTFRCKDATIVYEPDSTKACALRGGVDSVFAKPKPQTPNP